MKQLPLSSVMAFLLALFCPVGLLAQSVGIGTQTPNASAQLEVSSTSQGLLMPRMTTAQRDAIVAPAKGLLVYNLDDNSIDRYNGARWQKENGLTTLDSITAAGHPTPNSWVRRADAGNTARTNAVAFSIGGKGYLGTGNNLGNRLKDFWSYDPLSNAWTQLADFGGAARDHAVGFAIGDKGYVGSGTTASNYTNDFWEYNPATNTWSSKAPVPGPTRNRAVGFGLAGKGYVGTGEGPFADFYSYDPATNSWTTLPDFPGAARRSAVAFTIGSMAYVGLGDKPGDNFNDIYPFNPATNTWGSAITSQAGLSGLGWSSFTLGNLGYVGMGNGDNQLFAYNPATNSWSTKAAYPGVGRSNGMSFAIGNKGYMGTGIDPSNPTRDFWEYMDNNSQAINSTLPSTATGAITDGAWTLDAGTVYKSSPGNVGIGTTTPAHPLSVGVPTSDGQALTIRGYSNIGAWKGGAAFGYTNAAVIMGELGGAATIGGHSGTLGAWANLIINPVGGFVGIGTSSPTTALEVGGKVKATSLQITGGAAAGRVLQSDANGNASWASVSLTETDPSVGANTSSFLSKWNGTQLVASTVREDAGNVGIGVTGAVAGSRLQVNSANNNGGSTDWIAANLGISAGNADRLVLGTLNGVPTVGAHKSDLAQWANLAINPGGGTGAGFVGIGLNNPQAKLHVNGTMRLGGQGTPFSSIYSQDAPVAALNNLPPGGAGVALINLPQTQTISEDATIIVTPKAQLTGGITLGYAWRSGANQISVYYFNHFNSTNISLAAHTVRVTVINFDQ